jgi:glutamyl-tRNA reductase
MDDQKAKLIALQRHEATLQKRCAALETVIADMKSELRELEEAEQKAKQAGQAAVQKALTVITAKHEQRLLVTPALSSYEDRIIHHPWWQMNRLIAEVVREWLKSFPPPKNRYVSRR